MIHTSPPHGARSGPAATAATALLGALLLTSAPASAQENDSASVRDGVYTEEQAVQGRDLFDRQCGLCHAPGEFSGPIFQASWNNRPVGAFFSHIRGAMPLDNPGSLSAEEYAAVTAYVLSLNGHPAGDEPLPADPDSLSVIRIEPPPSDGR